jgi:hypothetical protein
MTDVLVLCTRQREVIEFLNVEDFSPAEIHRSVYDEGAIDAGSDAGSIVVRTVKMTLLTSLPATAATTESKAKVGALLRDDSPITTRKEDW